MPTVGESDATGLGTLKWKQFDSNMSKAVLTAQMSSAIRSSVSTEGLLCAARFVLALKLK